MVVGKSADAETVVLAGTLAGNLAFFISTLLCFHRVRQIRQDQKVYAKKRQELHLEQDRRLEGTLKLERMKRQRIERKKSLKWSVSVKERWKVGEEAGVADECAVPPQKSATLPPEQAEHCGLEHAMESKPETPGIFGWFRDLVEKSEEEVFQEAG